MADALDFRHGLYAQRLPMDPVFYHNQFADQVQPISLSYVLKVATYRIHIFFCLMYLDITASIVKLSTGRHWFTWWFMFR